MSKLIILLIINSLVFFIGLYNSKDILSPPVISSGSLLITLATFVGIYSLYPQTYDYFKTFFVLSLFSIIIVLGAKLSLVRFKVPNSHIIYRKRYLSNYEWELSKASILLLLVLVAFCGAVSGIYRIRIYLMYEAAGAGAATNLGLSNNIGDIISELLYALTYFIEYTIVRDIVLRRHKYLVIRIIMALPANIIDIVCGTRLSVFIELMYLLSLYNLMYRKYIKKAAFNLTFKIIRYFALIILSFIVLGFITDKVSREKSAIIMVFKYLSVGDYGLSRFLSDYQYDVGNFGKFSFNNVRRFFSILGFKSNYLYTTLGTHYMVSQDIGTANLYTGYMGLLNDFGYIGTGIVIFTLSFLITRFYNNLVYDELFYTPFRAIFYSSLFYLAVTIWIDLNPINIILSSSYFVRMLFVYLLCRLLRRRDSL